MGGGRFIGRGCWRGAGALAVVCAALLTACATSSAVLREQRAQQNTAVVLAFLDTLFNKHEVERAFDLYVGPQYRQHNPGLPDGREAAQRMLRAFTHELYPQLRLDVRRTVAQGDLVAVHSHYIPIPGERGQAAVDIFRLERGRIVEHWDVVEDVPARSANDKSMY